MEVLDIFAGDAFTMASLTDTINHLDLSHHEQVGREAKRPSDAL